MAVEELRNNKMMAHLLDSLAAGQDIGHYGRLVFTMVGRHFMDEGELIRHLTGDPTLDETKAKALVCQVSANDYNPPKRDKVLEFMRRQDFPICPDSGDPDACNVYKDLALPGEIFEKIQDYREQKAKAD
jgi:hypothetical protein